MTGNSTTDDGPRSVVGSPDAAVCFFHTAGVMRFNRDTGVRRVAAHEAGSHFNRQSRSLTMSTEALLVLAVSAFVIGFCGTDFVWFRIKNGRWM